MDEGLLYLHILKSSSNEILLFRVISTRGLSCMHFTIVALYVLYVEAWRKWQGFSNVAVWVAPCWFAFKLFFFLFRLEAFTSARPSIAVIFFLTTLKRKPWRKLPIPNGPFNASLPNLRALADMLVSKLYTVHLDLHSLCSPLSLFIAFSLYRWFAVLFSLKHIYFINTSFIHPLLVVHSSLVIRFCVILFWWIVAMTNALVLVSFLNSPDQRRKNGRNNGGEKKRRHRKRRIGRLRRRILKQLMLSVSASEVCQ